MQQLKFNYLLNRVPFKFKWVSVIVFFVIAALAWFMGITIQASFPQLNNAPYFIGMILRAIVVLAAIFASILLLKQNGLPAEALGLTFSKKTFLHVLAGIFIGLIFIALLGISYYMLWPFHFVAGPLTALDVLKDSYSYLFGNFLEELLFRGFLLVIFSQLIGWQKAAWILALPFGLFHLQGTGLTVDGLKMVATTSVCSFIFIY